MQHSQADINWCQNIGEEEQILFKPSPNFKNMKKFLKSKIDFSENSNQSPPNGGDLSPTYSSSELTTKEEQMALLEKAKSVLTPLPANLHPMSPLNFNMTVDQEIDTDYVNINHNSPELARNEVSQLSEEANERTKPTICRDFIRGTCSRAGSCKYAHERDLTQLPGVYRFCRNFQNTVCTLPHCRYVHATVFEEQRFYRTGVLPPHALAHHKKPSVLMPPPPPPPPPPPQEEPPVEVPIFAHPPPALMPSADKPIITCVPTANLEARPAENDFRITLPRDIEGKSSKKCKNCDTMEFRLQFNKDKTENMKRTADDLKNKVGILTKKTQTLYTVLWALIKPQTNKAAPGGLNGLSSLLNLVGDNEKNLGRNLSSLLKETTEANLVAEATES